MNGTRLMMMMGPLVAQAGGPGAVIKEAIDKLAPQLQVIGISLMTLGFVIWGLAKLAAPVMPELAASTQGYINKAFLGMLMLGMAATLASFIGGLFPGGATP